MKQRLFGDRARSGAKESTPKGKGLKVSDRIKPSLCGNVTVLHIVCRGFHNHIFIIELVVFGLFTSPFKCIKGKLINWRGSWIVFGGVTVFIF